MCAGVDVERSEGDAVELESEEADFSALGDTADEMDTRPVAGVEPVE